MSAVLFLSNTTQGDSLARSKQWHARLNKVSKEVMSVQDRGKSRMKVTGLVSQSRHSRGGRDRLIEISMGDTVRLIMVAVQIQLNDLIKWNVKSKVGISENKTGNYSYATSYFEHYLPMHVSFSMIFPLKWVEGMEAGFCHGMNEWMKENRQKKMYCKFSIVSYNVRFYR